MRAGKFTNADCDACTERTKRGCGQLSFYTLDAARNVCRGPFSDGHTPADQARDEERRLEATIRAMNARQ